MIPDFYGAPPEPPPHRAPRVLLVATRPSDIAARIQAANDNARTVNQTGVEELVAFGNKLQKDNEDLQFKLLEAQGQLDESGNTLVRMMKESESRWETLTRHNITMQEKLKVSGGKMTIIQQELHQARREAHISHDRETSSTDANRTL